MQLLLRVCSVDMVRTIQCSIQLTAARFRHQLHLSSRAAPQIGVHRRLRRVPDSSSFERVVETTAWPRSISVQVLSSHSVVSSSRTVRPCSPWGGRWIGHWRTTWLTVCSFAPLSQASEKAIRHLYKQERKRPTPVRRRLSWTQAILWRVIPGGGGRG